jgi:hypothetical protein
VELGSLTVARPSSFFFAVPPSSSFVQFEEEKLLDQPELMKKLTEGTGDFTFRDMYEQFQNLLKVRGNKNTDFAFEARRLGFAG